MTYWMEGPIWVNQDISASFVLVICIGRVHGVKHVRGSYPNRRIFVTSDVKNEEAICLGIVGRQRRDVPATFLANRHPQIVDDHEMIFLAEIFPGLGAKFIKSCVTSMSHVDVQGLQRGKPPS